MAVFRVEKTKDYTVMSNHHLKNKGLSLKAKGLLTQMLSLPEDWDYTLRGLSAINRESIDAIREAVKELERAGYIERSRARNVHGHLKGTDYTIYEKPILETPAQDKPTLEKPTLAEPTLENPMQLKTKGLSTKGMKDVSYLSDLGEMDGMRCEDLFSVVMAQIEFGHLCDCYPKERVEELLDLMVETLISRRKTILVASAQYPAELVKQKLRRITSHHIHYVFETMDRTKADIRNIKQYLLTVLFNAPSTIDNYYTAKVNYDFAK